MNIESSQTYSYIGPSELASSGGFAVEYNPIVTDREIRDDVISYLGEYRFSIDRYDYSLDYYDGMLRDPHRGESMRTKAERSVKDRLSRGESVLREAAEARGLQFLDVQLESASHGDNIVWASPPGEKSEGYGDYGFLYKGKVICLLNDKKVINMSAYRLEKPTMEAYGKAFNLLTGINYEARNPEDYLKFPVVVKGEISDEFVAETIGDNFPVDKNPRQKEIFDLAMIRISPKIDDFIKIVRYGTKEQKKKAFHALENYSLRVKRELEEGIISVFEADRSFDEFVEEFGYIPPDVSGSCPIKSSNVFGNSFEKLAQNLGIEIGGFECETCRKPNLDNHYHCPGCTKEFSNETNLNPDERTKKCACGFNFNC